MIPNLEKLFGGTDASMYNHLRLTFTNKRNNYLGIRCLSLSQDLQPGLDMEITVLEGILKFQQCANHSRPLTITYPWLQTEELDRKKRAIQNGLDH